MAGSLAPLYIICWEMVMTNQQYSNLYGFLESNAFIFQINVIYIYPKSNSSVKVWSLGSRIRTLLSRKVYLWYLWPLSNDCKLEVPETIPKEINYGSHEWKNLQLPSLRQEKMFTKWSFDGFRGILFMMSVSGCSKARDMDGMMSVPRSTRRIVTAPRGSGMPIIT